MGRTIAWLPALPIAFTLGCTAPAAGPADATGTGATDEGTSGDAADSAVSAAGSTRGDSGPAGSDGPGQSTGGAATDSEGEGPADDTGADTTGSFPEPELDDCIVSGAAGGHEFACDGLTYNVSIPPQCLSQACGLIFDVHGRTMSGAMQENNTRLRALGVERGYIVVQPNATPAAPLSSWNAEPDDDKVYDFVLRMLVAFHVDPDRVHMTGFSQGGFMTWRMACEHADLFASVAPAAACGGLAGAADCNFEPGAQPSEPLPILYMHGVSDASVSFSCAEPRRDAVLATFGLSGPETVSGDDAHQWVRYADDAGMVFEYLIHEYQNPNSFLIGHCFPGADDPGTATGQLFPFSCVDETAFVWGEAVMDFFEAHPKSR